ncbi:MAG TPA: LpqB family beta-propeller domain-containing protein [bacterium]|nr:LpqB family beta-propeller domain-containing protein [bacterium]
MSKSLSSFAAVSLLMVVGAGCLLGGSKTPTAATGGLWVSEAAGESWAAKSTLLSAAGNASINGLDILAIEQDPSDASVMYLGTKTSGLFYTLDGGESWQRPEDKAASSGTILAVEVDPKNVCTYFVLKADRLLKTTTCGREFDNEAYVETRAEEALTALAIDWYNPNTLLLGTTRGDVLRSLDGGATWTAVDRVDSDVTAISVSNADSRIVLVGTKSRGIYRTTDGGTTWTEMKKEFDEFEKAKNVYSFSQTKDGSRFLMRSGYGLMYSDDSGASWSPIALVTDSAEVAVRTADISPTNKDEIYYATDTTFYASTSGGKAWSTANLPSTRAASVIHVDAGNTARLFLGVVALEK